jgi:diacylglycerol kinase family enzyme
MLLAGLRVLQRFPVRRLMIRAEGWTEPCRTPLLFVGNNAYEVSLPNLGKRPRLDRGELVLYVAKPQGRASLMWLAFRAALGLVDRGHELRTFHVRAAEIHARASRLHVAADGEVELMRPPLRYSVTPRALHVFAPVQSNT